MRNFSKTNLLGGFQAATVCEDRQADRAKDLTFEDHFNKVSKMYYEARSFTKQPQSNTEKHRIHLFRLEYENSLRKCKWHKKKMSLWDRKKMNKFESLIDVLQNIEKSNAVQTVFQSKESVIRKESKDKKVQEKLSDIEKVFRKKSKKIEGYEDNAIKRIKNDNPDILNKDICVSDYTNDDATDYYSFKKTYAMKRLRDKKRKKSAKKAQFQSLAADIRSAAPGAIKHTTQFCVNVAEAVKNTGTSLLSQTSSMDLSNLLNTGYSLKEFVMLVSSLAGINWSNKSSILFGLVPVIDRIRPDLFSEQYREVLMEMIGDTGSKMKSFFEGFLGFLTGKSKYTTTHFQSEDGIDAGLDWKNFIHSDISVYGFRLLTFLVSSKNLKPMDVKWSGIEFFAVKAQKEAVKATEFIDCIFSFFVSVSVGFRRYLQTGNFSAMFPSESLEARTGELLSYLVYAKTKIIFEKTSMTLDDYLTELQKVKTKLVSRVKTEERFKTLYVTLLTRVQTAIADLGTEGIRQGAKMTTFGILLVGGSAVGKSWISAPLLDYTLRCNNFPAEPENKAVINSACKHDDTITNATRGINFDDLSTRKANASSEMCDEERVMQMHNNVTYPANKASIEEKASTMMNILVDIGSTNSEFLNAIELMKCPEAVLRRWQMHVKQIPRPQFRKPGTTMLDPKKVTAYFGKCQWPDAWEFRISECVSIEPSKKGGKTFKMITIDPENGRDYFNIKEFLQKILEITKSHFILERESLKSRTTVVKIDEETGLPADIKMFDENTYLVPSQVQSEFQADEVLIEEVEDETDDDTVLTDDPPNNDLDLSTVRSLADSIQFLHNTEPFFDFSKTPKCVRDLWVWARGDIVLFFGTAVLIAMFLPLFLSLLYGFPGTLAALGLFAIEVRMIIDYSRFLIQEMLANSIAVHRMHHLYNRVSERLTDANETYQTAKLYFSTAFFAYGVYKWYSNTQNSKPVEIPKEEKSEFQSNPEKEEEIRRPDPYQEYRGKKPFNTDSATMTTEDFLEVVAKSQCIVNVYDKSGHVNNCKGQFEEDRILRLPRHVFEPLDDVFTLEIFYNEHHRDKVVFDKREVKGKRVWQPMGQENVLLHLTDVRAFGKKKLSKYYVNTRLNTPEYSANLLTMSSKTFKKERYNVFSIEDELYNCELKDDKGKTTYAATVNGYSVTYEGIKPVKGMCGALVISSSKPHFIIGVHNAADNHGFAKICPILKTEVDDAIATLLKNSFYTQVDTSESYEFHSNTVKSKQIHPRNACNEFSTYTAVDIFGDIGRNGNTNFSTIETPMKKEVLQFFGAEKNPYVVAPSRGCVVDGEYKDPWNMVVRELNINSANIPSSFLERAHNIALMEIDELFEDYMADESTLKRILTIDEAVNGIPGVKAANGIKMTTSAGHKYGGKKGDHVSNDAHPYTLNDYVVKDVEEKIKKYSENKTTDTVFKFCLKDEAIKESKAREFRTRAFSALPIDAVVAFNMYYTASCSFLYNHPLETGCAISLDPANYDQDRIHNHLVDGSAYFDENGVIVDIRAFDKTLQQSLMRKQWDKHTYVSKKLGFPKEHLTVMEAIAEEQVSPVCIINGAKVRLNFSHTSGNGATSQIGSSAGKDLVRAAILSIAEDNGIELTDKEVILLWKSVHMGDDLKSVVHKNYKWFNFFVLYDKLKEWNVTITMPDKTSAPTKFQSVKDHDFLKRMEFFCELRNSYVGRLDESSLMKCLLFYLPSKKEEKEMQLGQMFASVLDEYSLYDEEKYEKFRKFANEMKEKYNLKIYNASFTYHYQVMRWMYEQSKLHSSYHKRSKPQLQIIASKCEPLEHWMPFLTEGQEVSIFKSFFFQSAEGAARPPSTYRWRVFKENCFGIIQRRQREWEEMYQVVFFFYDLSFMQFALTIFQRLFGNPFMYIWVKFHFVWYKKWFGRDPWILRAGNDPKRYWRAMTYVFSTGIFPSVFGLTYCIAKLTERWRIPLIDWYIRSRNPPPTEVRSSAHLTIEIVDVMEEYFPWANDEMYFIVKDRFHTRLREGLSFEDMRQEIREMALEFEEVVWQYDEAVRAYDNVWMRRIQHHGVKKFRRRIKQLEQGTVSSPTIETVNHSDGAQGNEPRGSAVDYHSSENRTTPERRRHSLLTASPMRGILLMIFIFISIIKTAGSVQGLGSNELSNPKETKELTEQQQQQNVDFNITNTGFISTAETGSDPSMSAAKQPDLTLTDFPLRPVKIAELVWTGSVWNFDEINPWEELLSTPTVARKLANFKMMKAKLVLDFIANGSPYLSGRGMFYYNPLHTKDNFRPANIDDRLCRISQRPHIYIDPTNSSGGTIEIPFIWPKNAVSIPYKEWQQLGVLNFIGVSDLRHTNGETPYVNVTVMAHLENLELYQTTETTVSEFQSENKRVISRTATAVGNIAGKLKKAPVIGPYARATEEVARTVGDIAQVFGFSKPNIGPATTVVKTTKFGTLAPTNDFDTSSKLTLDCKNETTIDPAVVGVSNESEMTIPEVVNHECLLTRFRWDINDDTDTELLRIPITPYIRSTFPDDGKIDLPPCAYMSTFFQHWRGTMEYEIDIICSKFHRGKLAMRVEPHGTSGKDEYNVTQREIFDITETTQHGVSVGWSSDRNYLKICGPDKAPFVPGESPNLDYHNGVLVISVANNLQRPSPNSETFVDVLIRVRANKDMQYNIPHSRTLDKVQLLEDTGLNTPTPVPPPTSNIYPHPGVPTSINFQMGVYYYGWHVPNFNNGEGYVRKFLTDANGDPSPHLPLVIGRNPAGEEYDDRQRDVTRKQFDTMLKAGITFVVCSWWGSGSRTDIQFETAALPECGNTAHGHMRACIHYETATLKDIGNGYVWTTAVRDRVRSDMAKIKASYTTDADRYLFRLDNNGVHTQPVIFLYLFRSMPDAFKRSICDEINDVFANSAYPGTNYQGAFIVGDYIFGPAKTLPVDIQDKMGAITAYDVYGQTVGGSTKASIDSIRQYHDRIDEYRSLAPRIETFPTISPSYNDRGVRLEADHIGLDRALAGYDKGSLLKLHLESIVNRSGQRNGNGTLTGMVIINSWNEWHEETTIEPCVGTANGVGPSNLTQGIEYEPYGTKYVNLIGDFMVNSYVAQSDNADLGEAQEEHNHDMIVHKEMLHKQTTYAKDDLIYHGEKVASIGMMLSRFELALKVNTTSSGVSRLHLPAVPYYEVNRDDVDGATFYEVNVNRLSVLFLTRRGSMRWKALNDFHNTTPRIAAVKLEESSKLELLTNQPSNDTLADGWSGMAAVTGVYDPVLEWEVPYYSNERFHIARNLDRSNEIGHSHVYDTSAVHRNYYLVATGEDFTLSYFLGTPSVVIS